MANNLSIKEKSLHINMDSLFYGAIAEIGGGQETARHLFQAGGASNTVAKSISAYDKLFSDHFYNQGTPSRYVAEDRVKKMVDYEYDELINILDKKNNQKFFAFANTVETLNFSKTNQGNGWLGIAVEGSDRYHPNKFYIHVKLHENDTLLQQYTLGALGINLIHGGLFQWEDPRKILLTLLDNLDVDRVEIDYIYVEGPDLKWCDNRLLNLMLVSNDMTPAIMFDQSGKVQQPGDMLYKKNVIVLRGYFRPINNLGMEFIEDSLANFKRDEDYKPDNTIAFCEISLKYLMCDEEVDEKDFLHRVDLLNMMGQSVMVSKFYRYFQLVKYFTQFKLIKLRLVVGLPTFDKILDSSNYTDLRGGLLEATGALFQENVKMYLYPYIDMNTGEVIYPEDAHFSETNKLLWQYLMATKKILVLKSIPPQNLEISSEYISTLIDNGDESLINYVPEKVFEHIKENRLFGYNRNNK
ncbi:MAG: TonB-dependent receptor [Paludibacter sp.]|nr:TonB-dependent receptor [Paludibacter sp.]